MSMLPIEDKVYEDGRTKQSFKDSTDINKIIKKAQVAGGLAHALKYPAPIYGEFTGIDLLGAYQQIGRAQTIFDDLPAEIRSEFKQDAFKFAAFASDPANNERLQELLPAIGQPGEYVFVKASDEPIASIVAPVPPAPLEDPPAPPGAPVDRVS